MGASDPNVVLKTDVRWLDIFRVILVPPLLTIVILDIFRFLPPNFSLNHNVHIRAVSSCFRPVVCFA